MGMRPTTPRCRAPGNLRDYPRVRFKAWTGQEERLSRGQRGSFRTERRPQNQVPATGFQAEFVGGTSASLGGARS